MTDTTEIVEETVKPKKAPNWKLKNERRKENFDGRNRDHRNARALRRANGGAFGKEKKELKNFLALGTSAGTKS